MMPKTKVCYQCHVEKPLTAFSLRTASARIYRNICKECRNAYARVYSQTPERRKKNTENMARWRAKEGNKERQKQRFNERKASGPNDIIRAAWHNAKMRAPVLVTKEQLVELWNEQRGRCALSGLEMTLNAGRHKGTGLSIDRIDPHRPYELGNVRLVCDAINRFRGRMTDDCMLAIARSLVEFNVPSLPNASSGILAFGC